MGEVIRLADIRRAQSSPAPDGCLCAWSQNTLGTWIRDGRPGCPHHPGGHPGERPQEETVTLSPEDVEHRAALEAAADRRHVETTPAERLGFEEALAAAVEAQTAARHAGDVEAAVRAYASALEAAHALQTAPAARRVYQALPGRRYFKVVSSPILSEGGAAHSFVDADGAIWKAASWSAPARNFPRGNVFTLDLAKVGAYVHGF